MKKMRDWFFEQKVAFCHSVLHYSILELIVSSLYSSLSDINQKSPMVAINTKPLEGLKPPFSCRIST